MLSQHDFNRALVRNLEAKRAQFGVSMTAMAALCGVAPRTYQTWVSDGTTPKVYALYVLWKRMGIPWEGFLDAIDGTEAS